MSVLERHWGYKGWVRVVCHCKTRRCWRVLSWQVLFPSCRCVPTWPLVIFLVPHGVDLFTHGMALVTFGVAIDSSELEVLFLALS